MALLDIRNLHVHFRQRGGEKIVVEDVSLSLRAGKTLALVGESGSGKTVTGLSILGLLPYPKAFHPKGEIFFQGHNLLKATPAHLQSVRTRKIGIVFQEPMTSLNPLHTLEKQIGEVVTLHQGLTGKDRLERIQALLDLSGFSEGKRRLQAYPHQLSGGQRQRVMIAMALACDPVLLIADEPTTALDVTTQAELLKRLQTIQHRTGMTLLLITHNMRLVHQMAEEVAVMQRGKIIEMGSTSQVMKNPQHPYTKELLDLGISKTLSHPVSTKGPLLEVTNLNVGFDHNPWAPTPLGRLLKLKPGVLALQKSSFSLCRGETVGIVGESGSGKTTLALAILRIIPSTGRVIFAGHDLKSIGRQTLYQVRRNMQLIFQDPFGSLNPRLCVLDIVGEGLKLHHPQLTKKDQEAMVAQTLIEVGLNPDDIDRYPHEFSGGQRQRIAIARALILKPQLIILDEPTSALDLSVQRDVLSLLQRLQKEYTLSYLLITHNLQVIKILCHRTLVMQQGKIVEAGLTDAIFQNPQHAYTRTLIDASADTL